MLIKCPECTREVSDKATSCPHCGNPLAIPVLTSQVATSPAKRAARSPVFLLLGFVCLVLAFTTPKLLLFFPLLGALGFSIVSVTRGESGTPLAVLVMLGGVFVWYASSYTGGSVTEAKDRAGDVAEITSWNWVKNPNFGGRGKIVWNVEVRNKSPKHLRNVKVEFATYDGAGKLVSSDFTYVSAIPPGQTRSSEGYAELYGTESKANAQVADFAYSN